jgi:molybdopterin-guanine dinucleotide biosynthesis protein A
MSDISRTPLPAVRFGGIILAGGRSTRMGRPKAWLPVGGRTMLETVVGAIFDGLRAAAGASAGAVNAAVKPGAPNLVAAPIVVVGAPGQELPPAGEPVLRVDDDVEGEGPLRGMAAGLGELRGKADAAFVSSCDVPLLRPAFVARLIALLGDNDIAVPWVDGLQHPLAAVYRIEVLETVRDLLARQMRRPSFLFERRLTRLVPAAELEAADPRLDSLKNFNTPDEYESLVRSLETASRPGRQA